MDGVMAPSYHHTDRIVSVHSGCRARNRPDTNCFRSAFSLKDKEFLMAVAAPSKVKSVKAPQVKDQPLFIGGKWLDSVSNKTFPAINPATGEAICQVAEGDAADIDLAAKAARKALESGPWKTMD